MVLATTWGGKSGLLKVGLLTPFMSACVPAQFHRLTACPLYALCRGCTSASADGPQVAFACGHPLTHVSGHDRRPWHWTSWQQGHGRR